MYLFVCFQTIALDPIYNWNESVYSQIRFTVSAAVIQSGRRFSFVYFPCVALDVLMFCCE